MKGARRTVPCTVQYRATLAELGTYAKLEELFGAARSKTGTCLTALYPGQLGRAAARKTFLHSQPTSVVMKLIIRHVLDGGAYWCHLANTTDGCLWRRRCGLSLLTVQVQRLCNHSRKLTHGVEYSQVSKRLATVMVAKYASPSP